MFIMHLHVNVYIHISSGAYYYRRQHGMTRLGGADGADGVQILRTAPNITDMYVTDSRKEVIQLGVGRGTNNTQRKNPAC
jgi:hypothetical protein